MICERCHQESPADEFVAQKNGKVMPWCLTCRRLWSAEKNGICCADCGHVFIRTSKRDNYCVPCRKARGAMPVERVATRSGSLLNPQVDPESALRWRETRREWAEAHGVGTWA